MTIAITGHMSVSRVQARQIATEYLLHNGINGEPMVCESKPPCIHELERYSLQTSSELARPAYTASVFFLRIAGWRKLSNRT